MKVKVLAYSLAGLLAVSATANAQSNELQTEPGKKVLFKKNAASDNWFIQLQGGVNAIKGFGTHNQVAKDKSFTDQLGMSFGLGLGKWHNPYFGTRLMVDYNQIVDAFSPMTDGKLAKAHSLNPHFDFMFDMTNYFGVYRADRGFHFTPFLGVGYGATQMLFRDQKSIDAYWDKFNLNHTVTGNMGVELLFNLGKRVGLTITPSMVVGKFLNTQQAAEHQPLELLGQLRAGLTFNAGRTDWEVVEPMDYALLNDLNSQINALRAQNEELSKRPVECPECPDQVAPTTVVNNIVDNVVYFRINSAKVDRNQMINVFNTAEFVKANKIAINVVGYADEDTGTAQYNMSLSEKRAREVARILVDEYGVPSELISIDWKGSDVQPFANNAWNRVVIMKANN